MSDQQPRFDRSYANRTLVLFAVLAAFVFYVDIMLTPSLPRIALDYHVSIAQVSLIIALYTVFGVATNPVAGKLGDIYGKKKILTAVLLLYTATVVSTSFAPTFPILLISRMFQGIGLSIIPLAESLVREEFPSELVPRAQGLLGAMYGVGFAVGIPVGAFVANSYGWQANYHIATPFIIALTAMIVLSVKESAYKKPGARLDYAGSIFLGLSLGMIAFGLSEGPSLGWTSPTVLVLIVVGLFLFAPLLAIERRAKEPILDGRLLSRRNILIANSISFMIGLGLFIAFQSISFEMELPPPSGFGFDIFKTGLYLVPLAVTFILISYPLGVMISKIGAKPFILAGGIIASLGFILVSIATTPNEVAAYLVVMAVGLATMMVGTQNLLVFTVRRGEMGIATSMLSVFQNMGNSLGAPVSGSILSSFTVSVAVGVAIASREAFQYSFYIASAIFLIAFVISLMSKEVLGGRRAFPNEVDEIQS